METLNTAQGDPLAITETAMPNKSLLGLESHVRSLIKALSYRVSGSVITGGIVWVITREVSFAVTAGVTEILIKTGFYYLHERVWDHFSFGRRGA